MHEQKVTQHWKDNVMELSKNSEAHGPSQVIEVNC